MFCFTALLQFDFFVGGTPEIVLALLKYSILILSKAYLANLIAF